MELDGDKIKDSTALDALISGDFSGLVSKTNRTGAKTETPPANSGGGTAKTKAEIMAIKDPIARQQEIANNPELFGIQ